MRHFQKHENFNSFFQNGNISHGTYRGRVGDRVKTLFYLFLGKPRIRDIFQRNANISHGSHRGRVGDRMNNVFLIFLLGKPMIWNIFQIKFNLIFYLKCEYFAWVITCKKFGDLSLRYTGDMRHFTKMRIFILSFITTSR